MRESGGWGYAGRVDAGFLIILDLYRPSRAKYHNSNSNSTGLPGENTITLAHPDLQRPSKARRYQENYGAQPDEPAEYTTSPLKLLDIYRPCR